MPKRYKAKREMIETVQQTDDFMRLDNDGNILDGKLSELESKIRTSALALYDNSCELPARVAVVVYYRSGDRRTPKRRNGV
ncbi:MAG: hypothetical protein IPP74_15860 [Alphaproteobacteria bacterium]|nr:hypothetical protein [Alphaproteobacteria bacterium]